MDVRVGGAAMPRAPKESHGGMIGDQYNPKTKDAHARRKGGLDKGFLKHLAKIETKDPEKRKSAPAVETPQPVQDEYRGVLASIKPAKHSVDGIRGASFVGSGKADEEVQRELAKWTALLPTSASAPSVETSEARPKKSFWGWVTKK